MPATSASDRAQFRVVLFEWHLGGHHLTYYVFFARVLRELGCQVLALHVDAASVEAELTRQMSTAWRDHIEVRPFVPPAPWPLHPTALYQAVQSYRYGRAFRRAVRREERLRGRPVDCVWISCLYPGESGLLGQLIRRLDRTWIGLYLQPARAVDASDGASEPLATILRDRHLAALATVDEFTAPKLAASLGSIPVVVVPDITDDATTENHPLAVKFRHLAGGRPLILAIGGLIPSKGMTTLARVAADPRAADLVFAFVGEVWWYHFSEADIQTLRDVFNLQSNTFFHTMRVPDGPPYNAVIEACDVLFAAYHDFPHSSNTLTKAALLRKPIIVSDGYVMAARVRKYGLGEVVPQNDPAMTLAAIRRITDDPAGWARENNPRWDDYLAEHSYAALQGSMRKLFAAAFPMRMATCESPTPP